MMTTQGDIQSTAGVSAEGPEEDQENVAIPGTPVTDERKRNSQAHSADISLSGKSARGEKRSSTAPPRFSDTEGIKRLKKIKDAHAREQRRFDRNIQLTTNMDRLSVESYVKWLGERYLNSVEKDEADALPLFEKILKDRHVHKSMTDKIKEIREDEDLMKSCKTEELFVHVSLVVFSYAKEDYRRVGLVYRSFSNILGCLKTKLNNTHNNN